jgi:flagellar M-ring protein FliF
VNSQISEERQRSGSDDESSQGVPGTASNVPGSTAQAGEKLSTGGTDSSDETVQKTENKTFAVSKTTRHLTEPSGILKKISAAVLVDDAVEVNSVGGKKVEVRRRRTPEEMKQILDIATTAIGIDATRGDRITVQNLSFVSLPSEVEVHPTWGGRVEHVVQDWSPLLKYVGIAVIALVIYLSFLKPLTSRVLTSVLEAKPALTADRAPAALPGGQGRVEGEIGFDEPLGDLGQELAGAGSEVKRVVALKRQLVDKIKTEPGTASRLVQKWVRQGEV